MDLKGRVISGKKRGTIFLSQKNYVSRIRNALGFNPYPGTLNLELDPEGAVKTRDMIEEAVSMNIRISGFQEKGKHFGGLRCYPCKASSKGKGIDGFVVIPDKTTHPPEIIELVSNVNIRESLSLKDKDDVTVELRTGRQNTHNNKNRIVV
jgi:riboflavin kinase